MRVCVCVHACACVRARVCVRSNPDAAPVFVHRSVAIHQGWWCVEMCNRKFLFAHRLPCGNGAISEFCSVCVCVCVCLFVRSKMHRLVVEFDGALCVIVFGTCPKHLPNTSADITGNCE